MSLYAEYLLEREGYSCLEDDDFFVTFKKLDDALYIRDMYISPNSRRKKKGTELGNMLEQLAKEEGCKALITSVDTGTQGWQASKKGIEKFGFKEIYTEESCIYYNKEIDNG